MSPVSLPAAVLSNQPLAGLTSWKVGGTAEYLAKPCSVAQLAHVVQWAVAMGLPIHPIGAGSNLLVSDEGVEGLILCLRRLQGAHFKPTAGDGSRPTPVNHLPTLARKAARAGLHGLEWLRGNPGNHWRRRCHERWLSRELVWRSGSLMSNCWTPAQASVGACGGRIWPLAIVTACCRTWRQPRRHGS